MNASLYQASLIFLVSVRSLKLSSDKLAQFLDEWPLITTNTVNSLGLLVLHNYDQLYIHICMQNHNDDTIKTSDTVLLKNIPLILLKGFERVTKGFTARGSWSPNRTATYWPPTLMAITAFLSRSPGLLNWGPGGPASLGAGSLYCILSPTGLIPNWLNFLCTELYNSSTTTFFLWALQIALI